MAENTNTEREAFESALKSLASQNGVRLEPCDFSREPSGEYEIAATEIAWAIWQARASLSLPAAGQEPVAWRLRGGDWHIGKPSVEFIAWAAENHPEAPIEYAAPQPAVAAGCEKALAPLRVWWAMLEAQWELCDETPSDDTVVLQFMGSGASTTVTAGQMRAALTIPPAPSTEGESRG